MRLLALLGKELRHHWIAALVLLVLVGGAMLLLTLGKMLSQSTTSIIESALFFQWAFVPLAGMVVGHRLVVAEYHARTQLFLEALPIRRWEPVLVKLVLGLVFLVSISLAATGWSCLIASRTEPVDARFLAILGARSAAWTAFVWSFLFLMGFLGRFRVPVYIALLIGLLQIGSFIEVDLWHVGPLELVESNTFAYERNAFPEAGLAITGIAALVLVVLAFGIALLNEGSLAESLAKRMSQKEKSVVTILFVFALLAVTALDKRKAKKPYVFTDKTVVEEGRVAILYSDEARKARAKELLGQLSRELEEMRAALGWKELPPVRVAHRGDLDDRTIEIASISNADGVLVRANLDRKKDLPALDAMLVHQVVGHETKHRATFEPKHWVLDGFSRWWTDPQGELPWRRALWATRKTRVTAELLHAWSQVEERESDPIATGLAFSGLRVLERERGRDAVLALARSLWGREVATDFREVLRERDHPLPKDFQEATGMSYEAFLAKWNEALDRGRVEEKELLEKIPEGKGSFDTALEGDARAISYTFDFERPPAPGTVCALVHLAVSPFDSWVPEISLVREEHAWRAGATRETWRLERYGKGVRVLVGLEVECKELEAPIRLATERRNIP